jgi:hypothetical protein
MTHAIPLWIGILWFVSGTLLGAGIIMVVTGCGWKITIQRKEQ